MTKQEAIEILRDTPIDIRSTREDDIHTLYATAQNMAIEALRCSDIPNNSESNSQNQTDSLIRTNNELVSESDVIYRQDALNCFHAWVDKNGDVYTPDDMPEYQAIEALPSAQRTGEWIDRSEGGRILNPWWESHKCDQCGYFGSGAWNYCPYCGSHNGSEL